MSVWDRLDQLLPAPTGSVSTARSDQVVLLRGPRAGSRGKVVFQDDSPMVKVKLDPLPDLTTSQTIWTRKVNIAQDVLEGQLVMIAESRPFAGLVRPVIERPKYVPTIGLVTVSLANVDGRKSYSISLDHVVPFLYQEGQQVAFIDNYGLPRTGTIKRILVDGIDSSGFMSVALDGTDRFIGFTLTPKIFQTMEIIG